MEDAGFAAAFRALGRRQAVIAGMEAHICVMQTAASLMEENYEVFVVSDATASRTIESERACIDRLGALGAGIVTTEMAIYEWLGRRRHPGVQAPAPAGEVTPPGRRGAPGEPLTQVSSWLTRPGDCPRGNIVVVEPHACADARGHKPCFEPGQARPAPWPSRRPPRRRP